ncbi:hypothetical protein [Metapseudomonas boanensis]|uniref:Uncharacterized protein n=1 Tax=Metapseudomonas boanensis TaxID=2822138 RepID=A0ABS5XLZ8_9GAMM|nr:hypothetical protein [Pseudomonas boanensis]MBT8768729.1 hypothetical protein [Pseudomonas boanensis]
MKMIKLAVLTTLAVATLPAMAAEYVLGVDYQPCATEKTKGVMTRYRDCTIPNTQPSYSEVYTADDGTRRVREIEGKFLIECSASRVCSSVGSKTYEKGFYAGNGDQGDYALTYNFYLDEDYNGNAVAYAAGRGPKFKEDPVGNPWASEKGGAPVAPGSEAWDEENE